MIGGREEVNKEIVHEGAFLLCRTGQNIGPEMVVPSSKCRREMVFIFIFFYLIVERS